MKKYWISTIYSLLIVTVILFAVSCSEEESESSNDLFYISTDIRTKVTEGLRNVSLADREGFDKRLEALTIKCTSPEFTHKSDAQSYMETEEYQDFKNYIVSIAPDSYYLLIEIFLKGDTHIGPFSSMFQDIVEASYPGLITKVLDQLDKATMDEFLVAYPQICVEHLLIEMDKDK